MTDTTPTTPDQPTASPTRFRRTRIAVAVVFGLMCLLVALLLVRSFWWRDNFQMRVAAVRVWLASDKGETALAFQSVDGSEPRLGMDTWAIEGWYLLTHDFYPFDSSSPRYHGFGIRWFDMSNWELFAPHWFVAFISGLLAVLALPPPLHRRIPQFSLRTLFIATTLVAAILGLIAWTSS
jgi:hypothetical protein